VASGAQAEARRDLAGYYAHVSALDACVGELQGALAECGLERNTLFVFTSDHGDMLGSHGAWRKQWPYDESVQVPLLVHWPDGLGRDGGTLQTPVGTPDLMPTLLGLCGLDVPDTVEGDDLSGLVRRGEEPRDRAVLVATYAPFAEWSPQRGGREYRGLRTRRWTYVRTLDGPWMLFDNEADPYQLANLVGRPEYARAQAEREAELESLLRRTGDEFAPASHYLELWGYETDQNGAVPYTD
jgi:arylsulfatase A-like enzyme